MPQNKKIPDHNCFVCALPIQSYKTQWPCGHYFHKRCKLVWRTKKRRCVKCYEEYIKKRGRDAVDGPYRLWSKGQITKIIWPALYKNKPQPFFPRNKKKSKSYFLPLYFKKILFCKLYKFNLRNKKNSVSFFLPIYF